MGRKRLVWYIIIYFTNIAKAQISKITILTTQYNMKLLGINKNYNPYIQYFKIKP